MLPVLLQRDAYSEFTQPKKGGSNEKVFYWAEEPRHLRLDTLQDGNQ